MTYVPLNFHEINTTARKFYPENLVFQDKGFIQKFSATKIWSHTVKLSLKVWCM